MKVKLNDFESLEEIHKQNKYISDQHKMFSEENRAELLKEFANQLEANLDSTISWLSSIGENKWNKLYESLEIIENEHKQNINTIKTLVEEKGYVFLNYNETLEAVAHLQKALNHIGFMLLASEAIANNLKMITAKQNRRKQNRTDPNKQKAIDEAKTMWKRTPKLSLDEIAEHIRQIKISDKSHAQIKKWIAPYNPNRKNK